MSLTFAKPRWRASKTFLCLPADRRRNLFRFRSYHFQQARSFQASNNRESAATAAPDPFCFCVLSFQERKFSQEKKQPLPGERRAARLPGGRGLTTCPHQWHTN